MQTLQRLALRVALAACLSTGVLAASTPSPAAEKPSMGKATRLLVIKVAEPSYPAILAVDLIAAAGLIWLFRRRLGSRPKSELS